MRHNFRHVCSSKTLKSVWTDGSTGREGVGSLCSKVKHPAHTTTLAIGRLSELLSVLQSVVLFHWVLSNPAVYGQRERGPGLMPRHRLGITRAFKLVDSRGSAVSWSNCWPHSH